MLFCSGAGPKSGLGIFANAPEGVDQDSAFLLDGGVELHKFSADDEKEKEKAIPARRSYGAISNLEEI